MSVSRLTGEMVQFSGRVSHAVRLAPAENRRGRDETEAIRGHMQY
jgi:hypothetical protein